MAGNNSWWPLRGVDGNACTAKLKTRKSRAVEQPFESTKPYYTYLTATPCSGVVIRVGDLTTTKMMDEVGWDDDLDVDDDDSSGGSSPEQSSNGEEGGTIQMGQGFLVGRLSRFLEAVTQPEPVDETGTASLGGWGDDDELDELVVDEQNDDDSGREENDVLLEDEPQEHATPPSAASVPLAAETFGWDDDLDGLDDESLHEDSLLQKDEPLQPSAAPAVQETGWEDELEGLDDTSLHEESQIQTEEPQKSGWDDDDALEGLDDSFQATETQDDSGWYHDSLKGLEEEPPLAPETMPSPTEEEGWGDDDLDNLDDDGGDFQGRGLSTVQQDKVVVDHVPTLRSPVRTESMITNADESTVLRENARDEEEFETSDDYGPVVDHLPSEHPQDHHAVRTVSTLVPESCIEVMEEENRTKVKPVTESNPNDVIDHVPDDMSNVPTDNDDSTASVDGDYLYDVPMQENTGEGDTTDGEFGPVVNRMPSDQNLPHAARTVSTVLPSSFNESLDEGSNLEAAKTRASDDQPLEVDHVPDNIEDVSIGNDDSTATVDGDEPCDIRDEQGDIDAEGFQSLEVDHVPDDVSNVLPDNDDSTATVEGDESSDIPVQDEAEEGETAAGDFGPVVDHTPSPHSFEQPGGTVAAIAPPSVNDEIYEDDNEGEAADGSTSAHAGASFPRVPGVVDHVPEDGSKSTNRNSTLAAATEMSVASELSNTLGDEALESDIDAKEENYGPVVDHTPLQQSIHSRRNPSVRVQAPIEEIDEEDIDEEQYFGPVVDHTPTVQVSTVSSVTGSMRVAAPPSEVDDDSDDRSDIVGENRGERSDYDHYDDDTLDAPTASIVSASKDGPTLVDHVPRRPGSRPTDASTLVVVDPSEVSTVGDITYEEQQYGPVVDHTPPALPLIQAATEDSTAVAAMSVGPDDTLVDTFVDDMDDVADEGRPRDENESEGDDGATLPTLDNPPPMETNVVDHVPEEDPPMFRIDSVISTAPTQSVLSRDETRDSDFGLVVDHLPTMLLPSPPSRGSMAVLAPPSVLDDDMESGTVEEEVSAPAGEQPASEKTTEEAKVLVDHLPPARDSSTRMHPTDSTVTVRSHISDDDTLEGIARPDRFGPVVDQLPVAVASIQRSLGGSTTGALATLSEVNDDTIVDEDAPGWDYDEQELDSIQDFEREVGENGRHSRARPASRGLSVTFSSYETVKTVQNLDEGAGNDGLFTSLADETQYFDAELGNTPAKSVNETQESQYFDPESGEKVRDDASLHINGGSRNIESLARCISCAEAKGATCPCVESILQANPDENSMVVSVMTPQGVPVEIDFKKLLQHETTKRLLLEKELEACHATIEIMESSISQMEAKSIEDNKSADVIRESTRIVTRELDSTREERDALAIQNEELSVLLTKCREKVSEDVRATEECAARDSSRQAEMEKLRGTFEESRSESQQLAAMSDELASELDQMRNANEELLMELGRQKGQCDALEAKNKGLVDDCSSKEIILSNLTQEKSDLSSRKSALEDEILQLRRSLDESSSRATSETDLRNQLSSLQIEAATKSGECEELRTQVEQIQKKLQESEGRNFAHMKESMRAKRLLDGEIQKLQEQLESLQKSKQAIVEERETNVRNLNEKVSGMKSELQSLKSENLSLRRAINDARSEHESVMKQERMICQQKISQMRALETKVKMLESEKTKASIDLTSMRSQLLDSAEQANAAAALKKEYDSLQETLAVNKETIQSLQEQVETLSRANKTGTDQMEALVASISSERDALRNALQSKENEMQALQSELHILSSEKSSLEHRLETLAAKCGELEASVENLQTSAVKRELELAEKDRLYESLRASQVDTDPTSQVREQYEREIADLNQLVSGNEKRLQLLQSQLEAQVNAIRVRDVTISELEQKRAETEERVEAITRDRDNTLSRFKELDTELSRLKEQQFSLRDSNIQHEGRERELQESLASLVNERDNALRERELLEEDNEELLVELGLLKQQLDAHASEAEELQKIAAEKEIAAKYAEKRLCEAEEYIAELRRTNEKILPEENGTHESGQLAALEQTIDELTLAKEDLQQQVDDLSSTNAYIGAQVTSLRDEKVELVGRLDELQQLKTTSGADTALREEQYQSRTYELEEQCRHLEELCKMKDEQLEQAMSQMHEAQVASASTQADINILRQQIAQLESACAKRDHALHDRDRALEDLRLEMECLRSHVTESNAPRHTSTDIDLDALQRKFQHAERSAQHYQERLREMEAVLEQTRQELKAKTEKLSETESTLFDRELELDLHVQDRGATEAELQKQLHDMGALLVQRNQQIHGMVDREQSLSELQSDMTGTHSHNSPSSSSVQPVAEEALQLRAQLSALRQQLQSSTFEHNEREERARQEVVALNESIARKNEQIESLQKQLQSLSIEFSSSQDQLVLKEADYRRLSMELEETLGDQLQSTRTVTSQVLEYSSKEQAESVDIMRAHIISLAQALERSETQRANAIERLLNERKASADSLRRLGESVKRFYSSLSYRDA